MTLNDIYAELAEHCVQIAKLLKPGARITILVRNPNYGHHDNSADLLVGDDTPQEIIKSVQYLSTREETTLHLREQISGLAVNERGEERQNKASKLGERQNKGTGENS